MSGFCEVMDASSDWEVWKIPVYGVPAVLFFGGVPESHVNLFGVCLTPTYTYSETKPRAATHGRAAYFLPQP